MTITRQKSGGVGRVAWRELSGRDNDAVGGAEEDEVVRRNIERTSSGFVCAAARRDSFVYRVHLP